MRMLANEMDARREGITQGVAQGQELLSKLIQMLLQKNDYEAVNLITSDTQKREEYYKLYNLK